LLGRLTIAIDIDQLMEEIHIQHQVTEVTSAMTRKVWKNLRTVSVWIIALFANSILEMIRIMVMERLGM